MAEKRMYQGFSAEKFISITLRGPLFCRGKKYQVKSDAQIGIFLHFIVYLTLETNKNGQLD